MSHKKLKKALFSLFGSTNLSPILNRSARGCFKSVKSYATKKGVARIFTNLTKIALCCRK